MRIRKTKSSTTNSTVNPMSNGTQHVKSVYLAFSLIGLFLALFTLLITIIPRYLLKPKDKNSVTLQSNASPQIAGPGIDLEHDLSIAAPATVRVSHSEVLTIRIVPHPFQHTPPLRNMFSPTPFNFPETVSDSDPPNPSIVDGEVVPKFPDSYTLSLTASADAGVSCDALSKKAATILDGQTWRCVIEPKTPGEHTILFSGLRFEHMLKRPDRATPLGIAAMDETTLQYKYVALTPWGLTEAEDRWIKLLAAFISIVGTILGYPFIKRLFDRPTPTTVVGPDPIPVAQAEPKQKATAAIAARDEADKNRR